MAITPGSVITALDVNGLLETSLSNLRTTSDFTNPYKQWTQTFRLDSVNNTSSLIRRTIGFYPRTDCVLRGIRLSCASTISGIVATVTIPAQIVENNSIVGGNIVNTISFTATSQGNSPSPISNQTSLYTLDTSKRYTILAGDSIDIVVSTNSATSSNITISLLLENILESR